MVTETKRYISPLQFRILKERKLRGMLNIKPFTEEMWLRPEEARELGFNEGESDFLLTPTPETLPKIPTPGIRLPSISQQPIQPVVTKPLPTTRTGGMGGFDVTLRNLYPETFAEGERLGETWDITANNLLKQIGADIETDPEIFYKDLMTKPPAEAEVLLKYLGQGSIHQDTGLPYTPDDVEQFIDEVMGVDQRRNELDVLLANIPELVEYDLEGLSDLMETTPNDFITLMRTGGITREKKAFLQQLGISDEEISKTFARVSVGQTLTPLPKLTWWDKVKELKDNPAQLLPYISSGIEIKQMADLLIAAKHLDDDKATPEDIKMLQDYVLKANQKSDFGYMVADTIADILPFALEFLITKGVYTASARVTIAAGEKVLAKWATKTGLKILEGKLAQLGVKAVGVVVGGTVQTIPAGGLRITASTLQKQLDATLTDDKGDDEAVWQSLVKSVGEQWVEVVSERTGGLLTPLTGAAKGKLLKMGLFKAFQTANPGKSPAVLQKILQGAGYNGVLGEMFEERVGDVMHGTLNKLGLSDQTFRWPTPEQLAVELVSFSVPGLAMKVASGMPGAIANARLQPERGSVPVGGMGEQSGEQIAKTLGVKYDGVREGLGFQFTDPQTGSTTYGNTLEEAKANLTKLREGFAAKTIPPATTGGVSEVKRPWEMTASEYADTQVKLRAGKQIPSSSWFKKVRAIHKERVSTALSEGKPVPAEVLVDYPDLAKQALQPQKAVSEVPVTPEVTKLTTYQGDTVTIGEMVNYGAFGDRGLLVGGTAKEAMVRPIQTKEGVLIGFKEAVNVKNSFRKIHEPLTISSEETAIIDKAKQETIKGITQAIPKAEVGMPETVKQIPGEPEVVKIARFWNSQQLTAFEKRQIAKDARLSAPARISKNRAWWTLSEQERNALEPFLRERIAPTAVPVEEAAPIEPIPTEVKQTEFVNEYLESKGQKPPPPPEEPPAVSTQFPGGMPASQQVANHISFEPDKVSLREKFLRGKNKAMSQWIDKLCPIDTFTSEAKKLGADISIEENPYLLARLLEGVVSKATVFLETGTFGRQFWKIEKGKAVPNFKGESLSKILEEVKEPEAWRDFSTYLTAHRARELGDLGIETGITPEVANDAIIELDMKYPGFSKLSDKITKYQADLLDYIQESGLISADLRAKLDAKYYAYVPFYRVLEELQGKGYMGKKMVDIASPIKRIKGSEREIINPLESIVKNTYAFISAADRNEVGVAMARLVHDNPELQGLFEPIKTPIAKVANVTAKELGIDVAGLTDDAVEEVFNIFRPSMFTKENVATVMIDGKKQFFKVDPDLNTALTAMDTANMGILWKILSTPAKWLRAGATLSPDFMIRNPARDALSAMVYSNYGFIPGVDFLRGVASIIKKDAAYKLYKMSGAEHSMLVSLDRDYLQSTFKQVVEGKKFTDYVKHPLSLLQIVSELGEKATRLGEFAKGIKSGANPLAAGMSSREVTLDFAKAGTQAKAVNQIIAFFNANIRGWDRMVTGFKEHPIRTSVKVFAGITLPSIILWSVNHDDERWKEIPQWQKDLFWIVMTDKNIYRIPKPFELGVIFGSGPERLLDYLYSKDPKMGKEYLANFLQAGLPGWIPTGIEPIIENITNHSFFLDRPIVPESKQDLPPELQYTEYTSEIAKGMGKLLKQSPMKIDNILYGWTAGLGRYATEAIDKILEKTGIVAPKIEPSPTFADLPVMRAFVVRNPIGSSSESVNTFYDELDAYTAQEKLLKGLIEDKKQSEFETEKAKHPELLFAYDDKTDTYYSASARYLRRVSGELSDIRKLQDKVYKSTTMTPEQKRTLIDSLDQIKTDMAVRALELIRNPSREVGILETPVDEVESKLGTTSGSPLSPDVIKLTDITADLAQAKGESPLKKLLEKNNTILADIANLPDEALYKVDRATTKAGLTRRQNELLDQYEASTDKKAFLVEHPELKENPKEKWLRDNPESNAILALWGNSKLLTQKAYDIAVGLVASNDIPDNTLSERVLPPKDLAKPYFDLVDAKEKWGDSSWEAKLIVAKNPKLTEWNPAWSLPDTPTASLELKATPEYHPIWDKLNKDTDPDWIGNLDDKVKDKDGLTARDRARTELNATKIGKETYLDVSRRVDAIEKGTNEKPTDPKIVDAHVEFSRIEKEAEQMLFRVDDKTGYDAWRTGIPKGEELHLEPLDRTKIPIWRIDAKYRKEDAEYDAIKNDLPAEQARLRDEYMTAHPEYRMDSRRREGYTLTNSKTGVKFPTTEVEKYVSYYELPEKGFEQERFLLEDLAFATAMHDIKGMDIPKAEDVPDVNYDLLYKQYKDKFDQLEGFADNTSRYYVEDPLARETAAKKLRFDANGKYTEFGVADLKRNAYGKEVPVNHVDSYVSFNKIKNEPNPDKDYPKAFPNYEDNWFMLENPTFHNEVWVTLLGNDPYPTRIITAKDGTQYLIDTITNKPSKTPPTREIGAKYIAYNKILNNAAGREENRLANPDLDNWGVAVGIWSKTIKEQRRISGQTAAEKFRESLEESQKEFEENLKKLKGG